MNNGREPLPFRAILKVPVEKSDDRRGGAVSSQSLGHVPYGALSFVSILTKPFHVRGRAWLNTNRKTTTNPSGLTGLGSQCWRSLVC